MMCTDSHPSSPRTANGAILPPLALLRAEMARRGVDAYLVPRADEHQGEYVPPSAMRLQWLTGFSGSAGLAVAMPDRAALFVDGRYTLQAAAQVDGHLFELRHLVTQPPHEWLAETLAPDARLGYDPWLFTPQGVSRLAAACAQAGAHLVALEGNLIDAVWSDRPAPPKAPVVAHPLTYAGRTSADKRTAIAAQLGRDGQAAAVLSAPDSIAWLLNIRGGDVPFAPLPLGFALINADATVDLFLDPAKVSSGLAAHLGPDVRLSAPEAFGPALDRLNRDKVRLDPTQAPQWVAERLRHAGAQPVEGADPCLLPKACKTDAELAGTRAAHHRDGVALTTFLAWLATEAQNGGLTEMGCARHLDALREKGELYREPSFPTISGAGPNGAIVHYAVTLATDRRLASGELYLVDSGGQYLDGTTDVTRTVAIGVPPAEARRHFTLVLKGHIALARARFPKGTTGGQLDVLARRALWAEGLDYDHGTGHGVGSYLSVHEGPQRISKVAGGQALLPGMIVSNEPGYYRTGSYGIRIENLLTVRPDTTDGAILAFETLTLAPIDRALIEPELLDAGERAWLDAYHRRVRAEIGPDLDPAVRGWLENVTRPLPDGKDEL